MSRGSSCDCMVPVKQPSCVAVAGTGHPGVNRLTGRAIHCQTGLFRQDFGFARTLRACRPPNQLPAIHHIVSAGIHSSRLCRSNWGESTPCFHDSLKNLITLTGVGSSVRCAIRPEEQRDGDWREGQRRDDVARTAMERHQTGRLTEGGPAPISAWAERTASRSRSEMETTGIHGTRRRFRIRFRNRTASNGSSQLVFDRIVRESAGRIVSASCAPIRTGFCGFPASPASLRIVKVFL